MLFRSGGIGRIAPIQLNHDQQMIVDAINQNISLSVMKNYLIHGITGSGKTEVYMAIMERVIHEGKQVILLIPEIALTFQTVQRFYGRFGDRVSILNSRLSEGERFDQYERIHHVANVCNIFTIMFFVDKEN